MLDVVLYSHVFVRNILCYGLQIFLYNNIFVGFILFFSPRFCYCDVKIRLYMIFCFYIFFAQSCRAEGFTATHTHKFITASCLHIYNKHIQYIYIHFRIRCDYIAHGSCSASITLRVLVHAQK